MICLEYLTVFEVSGEFHCNSAHRDLSICVLHCEDAVSIQLAVVILCFGNRFHEAVCLIFRNVAFVQAFLVDGAQLSFVLFC